MTSHSDWHMPPVINSKESLNELLQYAVGAGASDISIRTGRPPMAEIYGRQTPLGNRELTNAELAALVNCCYGDSGVAQINSSGQLDPAYVVTNGRRNSLRFRLNITSITVDNAPAFCMTFRSLGNLPPRIQDQNFPEDLLRACNPRQGQVLITGPTGSGKSTLCGGIIRSIAESPDAHAKILTYESPIEFAYDDLEMPTAIISQTSVPDQLPSFAEGVRNALRRKPSHILIGEGRDQETIKAICEAALTGHTVYSTVHTNGVPETISRMTNFFSESTRHSEAIDYIGSLQVIITQNLVQTSDGQRAPVREYLVFDEDIRLEMMKSPLEKWNFLLKGILKEAGRPLFLDVEDLYSKGAISNEIYLRYFRKNEERL